MAGRWYVTIRISETAGGDYAATEHGRPGVGRGSTPIRALVDYARTVERADHAERTDCSERCNRPEPTDSTEDAGSERSRDT